MVASNYKGPGFEYNHPPILLFTFINCFKDENKEKEAKNGPFLKINRNGKQVIVLTNAANTAWSPGLVVQGGE